MYRKEIIYILMAICCFLAAHLSWAAEDTIKKQDTVLLVGKTQSSDSVTVNKSQDKKAPISLDAKQIKSVKASQLNRKAKKTTDGAVKKTLSNALFQIAERIPAFLKIPVNLINSILIFAKKHLAQLIILFVSIAIIVLTLLFFRQRTEKNRFMTTTRLSVMDKEVQRACRFIENNFHDVDMSIDTLCTTLVTGKAFLAVLFEKELGMTVEDFIMQVRINRAKIMMNKDNTIDDDTLATSTGFCGVEPFRNAFEKITDISFDNYRKSLMTDQNVM